MSSLFRLAAPIASNVREVGLETIPNRFSCLHIALKPFKTSVMELPRDSDNEILSPAVARARLSDLDAQISALEISLRDLRRERLTVQAQLKAYRYPVLTLPYEITSEIFSHFLPAYPQLLPSSQPSRSAKSVADGAK